MGDGPINRLNFTCSEMMMNGLSDEVFERRRRRLMSEIGDDAVAIVVGAQPQHRSNDTNYPYRPSSDVLYLTGFDEPGAVVLLAPGHDEGEFAMFVPGRDPKYERWEGSRCGPEGAVEDFGADRAFSLDELDDEIGTWLTDRDRLYYTLGSDDEFDERVVGWVQNHRHRRNKPPSAPGTIVDLRDLLYRARLTKSAEELDIMRRAAEITAEAHIAAMKHCRPGMHEYELQALVEYHFRRNGAEFPAYTSIVGAGDNATVLHYTDNDSPIGADDVVLIDAGCEYGYYAADITRSFPADGTFSPAQRDIYQAVLDVQTAAIDDIEPGFAYEKLRQNTRRRLCEALVELELVDGSVQEVFEEETYRDYYPHSVGHSLGIDVHDVGLAPANEGDPRPLDEGMVLTVEPGIYVPSDDESAPEAMRGIGVRIEDDILVTADGTENLTASCPKEADDIEALVGSGDATDLELL